MTLESSTLKVCLWSLLGVSLLLGGVQESDAQAAPANQVRYKLLDLGTFGGPQSYVLDSETSVVALNNYGTLIGSADTPTPDPLPDFCFNDDCFVSHTFQARGPRKQDLRSLHTGYSSRPTWINGHGAISGLSENGETDPLVPGFPQFRAVVWRNRKIRDLGTLGGGYESIATALNAADQVVGLSTTQVPDPYSMFGLGYQTRAFFSDGGPLLDIGTLAGGTDAMAVLVNDNGLAVGWSYNSTTPSDICAAVYGLPLSTGSFVWSKYGGIIDVGGLGGTCTVAGGLNQLGEVVGQSWLSGDTAGHAFYWNQTRGLVDLGTLGGDYSSANAINDFGTAVGGSYLADNNTIHAALWNSRGALDLGAVGTDTCSYALAINNRSQVIGISGNNFCEPTRAFLWENGGPMVDINSLFDHRSGIYVTMPYTINDKGEIAALGTLPNGDVHAVLLVPCGTNDSGCASDASGQSALTRPPRMSAAHSPVRSFRGQGRRSPVATLTIPRALKDRAQSDTAPDLTSQDRGKVGARFREDTENSCPAFHCTSNHTSGSVCGFQLCNFLVLPEYKAYDRTYNRACLLSCPR